MVDYETRAGSFLGGPQGLTTLHHVGTLGGDVLRFDTVTEEFGILSARGTIRTYFRPDPMIHGLATNLAYFLQECARH
jgi:hypothetical protein